MKFSRQLFIATTSAALISSLISFTGCAGAATTSSQGLVNAQINGKSYRAIAVGDTTYLMWQALTAFHTPNKYLGSGKFAITGGTVQGVIYHGDTYLPWAAVAPKVKATPLKGGGFNFTSIPVSHDYQAAIEIQDGTTGSPDTFELATMDGNNMVPSQTVQINFGGSSFASGYDGQKSITVTTGADGTWTGALNDVAAETTNLTATWTDPSGEQQSGSVSVTFTNPPATTQTATPSDDTVVATVPLTTFQDALFFNAQGANHDILFQLDTGAYEPLLTKQVAQLLNLPNLGSTTVEGVGGQDDAYNSQMTLTIGGHQFTNIPCVVDDSYSGPSLFGYQFFADNGYDLLVSQKHNTLTILK